MEDRLEKMLEMQLKLQLDHMADDPRSLHGDEMADFMRWNAFALEDEIHEAMAEVGWKPWTKSRHVNEEAFLKEMVDAFHFFMNMLICAMPNDTPAEIATRFMLAYVAKNAVNAQRQANGYDGISTKCPQCHRELSETNESEHTVILSSTGKDTTFCNSVCAIT